MTAELTTTDLVRALRPPPPVFYQRQALSLLDEFLASMREDPSWDHRAEAALDTCRYELITRGGTCLGYLDLLRRAEAAGWAPGPLHATRPAPLLAMACQVRGREWHIVPRVPSQVAAARSTAYRLREQLRSLRREEQSDLTPGRVDLAIIVNQVGHLDDVAVLLPGLREAGLTVEVMTDDARVSTAAPATLPCHLLVAGRLHRSRSIVRARWIAARLAKSARRTAQPQDRLFLSLASRIVRRQLDRSLLAVDQIDDYLERRDSPAVLAVNPYAAAGLCATRLATARGVPAVAMQHGSVFWADPRWTKCTASRVCVWGSWSRDALAAAGLDSDTLGVTGAARFDQHEPVAGERRDQVLVAVSGAGDRIGHEQHELFVEVLAEAAASTPEIDWVVKLHPKDSPSLYAAAASRFGAGRLRVLDGPRHGRHSIFDHLAASRALVTVSSTAALDALRADVPVIQVQPWGDGGESDEPDFTAEIAAASVTTAVELADAARRAVGGGYAEGLGDARTIDRHLAHVHDAVPTTVAAIVAAVSGRDAFRL